MTSTSDDEPHASTTQNQDDNEIPILHHIVNPAAERPRNTHNLEIAILLLFFAWNLSGTVFQNQILFQTCTVTLNATIADCDALINDASTNEVCYSQSILKIGSNLVHYFSTDA